MEGCLVFELGLQPIAFSVMCSNKQSNLFNLNGSFIEVTLDERFVLAWKCTVETVAKCLKTRFEWQ